MFLSHLLKGSAEFNTSVCDTATAVRVTGRVGERGGGAYLWAHPPHASGRVHSHRSAHIWVSWRKNPKTSH